MCVNTQDEQRANMLTRMTALLPYFAQGKVVHGFGRGSKELGIPTANFDESVVAGLPKEFESGIYYGWANVNDGPIHKMVMSIGWNPFYHNVKRSMETHIIHKFDGDFYGALMKVCICGYIRPEKSFSSVDELIAAIKSDIAQAEALLEKPQFIEYKENGIFRPVPHL